MLRIAEETLCAEPLRLLTNIWATWLTKILFSCLCLSLLFITLSLQTGGITISTPEATAIFHLH